MLFQDTQCCCLDNGGKTEHSAWHDLFSGQRSFMTAKSNIEITAVMSSNNSPSVGWTNCKGVWMTGWHGSNHGSMVGDKTHAAIATGNLRGSQNLWDDSYLCKRQCPLPLTSPLCQRPHLHEEMYWISKETVYLQSACAFLPHVSICKREHLLSCIAPHFMLWREKFLTACEIFDSTLVPCDYFSTCLPMPRKMML